MQFKKPPLLPTLLTAASVAVLCGLGNWQAQKYFTKSAGRSGICQSGVVAKPQDKALQNLDVLPLAACPDKISVQGVFSDHAIIPIGPRVHDGEVGYHIYAPLRGTDQSHILVNLGWSKMPEFIFSGSAPTSTTTIHGSLMTPSPKGMFTLDNNPEKNEWYTLDIEEIAATFNIENLAEEVLFAKTIEPEIPEASFMPAELSKLYLTPETHLQYAGFWFFMALALFVIFILRFASAPDNKRT